VPAQYASAVFPQSIAFINLNTPWPKSYSTSPMCSTFWPRSPMLPEPTSLPPTRNSMLCNWAPASVKVFAIAMDAVAVPPPTPVT